MDKVDYRIFSYFAKLLSESNLFDKKKTVVILVKNVDGDIMVSIRLPKDKRYATKIKGVVEREIKFLVKDVQEFEHKISILMSEEHEKDVMDVLLSEFGSEDVIG